MLFVSLSRRKEVLHNVVLMKWHVPTVAKIDFLSVLNAQGDNLPSFDAFGWEKLPLYKAFLIDMILMTLLEVEIR